MKNILWASVLILVFLPQVSFGANQTNGGTNPLTNPLTFVNPALTAFNNQQGADAIAFFGQQASERGAFMKAHTDIIAKEELRFKREQEFRRAQQSGASTVRLIPPGDKDATFAAFVQKQQSDKQAFFAKQAQDKQNFLNSLSGTGTPTPSGT